MKLYELISRIKEEECVLEEMELEQEEKDKMASTALEKIRAETKNGQFSRKRRHPRRRIVVLAAAIVSVLAFSAVAYATDLFGFGKVICLGEEIEVALLEDSNQYKALKEYEDYINGLPKEKADQLGKEWLEVSKGAMADKNYTWHYYAPDKVKELCRKYNLKCEQKDTFVGSAQEAFSKAGMRNFFGDFADQGGQFSYSNQGSVAMILDKGTTYFDIFCIPNDVFHDVNAWAGGYSNTKNMERWDYTTKSGHTAKCVMYQDYSGDNGEENAECYEVAIPTENYIVTMTISSSAEDGNHTYSKEKLQKIIDQFDFSKLK